MSNVKHLEHFKPILVSLPVKLVEELDDASSALNCTRSHLIRSSLGRDLQVVKQEIIETRKVRQLTNDAHKKWIQSEEWDPRERPKKRSIKSFKQWLRDGSSR